MGWAPSLIDVNSAGLTTATTAYVTGDQLGTEITVTNAAASNAGYGAVVGIQLIDYSDVLNATDIMLFADTTTPATDNVAAAWSDADLLKSVAGSPIMMPVPLDFGGGRASGISNIFFPFKTGSGHANLYCDLITRSSHTFFGAVGDIKLRFTILQYS